MRLKEDSYSYKSSNIKRRMYRQSPFEVRGKYKSKKDTSKWCKGKIGIPHNFIEKSFIKFNIFSYKKLECCNCGKQKYV